METRYLESFLRIAETRSISRAAESLGLSQPSLSQQLLRLEDEVGSKLFFRGARGVSLTEAGRMFQEHARQLLRGTEQAIEDIRQLDAEPSGEVILAVPFSISRIAGVRLVEAFLNHAPHVSFRLVEAMTGAIRGWLEQAKLDLGIMVDIGPFRNLSSRPLAREELYLVGPAGAFGSSGECAEVPASAVAELPLILPGMPHGLRQVIEHEAARIGLTLSVRQDLDALRHLAPLVAAGHGYSLMPLAAVADEIATGQLSVGRVSGARFARRLLLVRNPASVVTHASVRAEDLILKVLRRLIEKGEWSAEAEPALQ